MNAAPVEPSKKALEARKQGLAILEKQKANFISNPTPSKNKPKRDLIDIDSDSSDDIDRKENTAAIQAVSDLPDDPLKAQADKEAS